MTKLGLDREVIDACNTAAAVIVHDITEEVRNKTTTSVERATLRLLGVEGDKDGVPNVNVIVDALSHQALGEGIGGNPLENDPVNERLDELSEKVNRRKEFKASFGEPKDTQIYVLTATGDVDEDVTHALAVAEAGGDIVAVIRSTAQSLMDHIPEGETHEGFGGTYATQANMRAVRTALDEWSTENGRYVNLSNFASGLCMPEISAIGVIEGLDYMVNDGMYGTLYRNINPVRTFVDQRFSRMINGWAGTTIMTGEDNYPRTADGMKCVPSVTASQFINYHLARASKVLPENIGVGAAFEVDPALPNSLCYEIAHAQLLRELFPNCPVKFMPPTKYADGNLWRTHTLDAAFNMVAALTKPGIQTIGVPTEGLYTPFIQDRVLGLQSVNYFHLSANSLHSEVEFSRGGIIQTRAQEVLRNALEILEHIADVGLFVAIEEGTFGDVKRPKDKGNGADGVIEKLPGYVNPVERRMLCS